MSKRARRLAKRNALQAVEEAIGSSLGKKLVKPKDDRGSAFSPKRKIKNKIATGYEGAKTQADGGEEKTPMGTPRGFADS